MDISKI